MSDDIARLGYEIDSAQALEAAANLAKMQAAAAKSANAMTVSMRAGQAQSKTLDQVVRAAQASERQIARLAEAQQNGSITGSQFTGEMNKIAARLRSMGMDNAQREVMRFAGATSESARAQAELARALAQTDTMLAQTEAGFVQAGRATTGYGQSAGFAASNATNLTFQLQDIAMMLAAGQNPLMLAMQQGTQVAGVFEQMRGSGQGVASTLMSAFVGLGRSIPVIAAIAGGAALGQWALAALGASDEAKTLADTIDELDRISGDAARANYILGMSVVELRQKYGDYADEVRRAAESMLILAEAEATQRLSGALADISTALDGLTQRSGSLFSSGTMLVTALQNIEDQLGLTGSEAREMERAFRALETAPNWEAQVDALRRIEALMAETGLEASKLPPELVQALQELNRLVLTTGEVKSEMKDAAGAAGGITGQLDRAVAAAGRLRSALADVAAAGRSRQDQIAVLSAQISAAERGASVAAAEAAAETALSLGRAGATVDQIAAAAQRAGQEAQAIEEMRSRLGDLTRPASSGGGGGGGGGGAATDEQPRSTLDGLLGQFREADPYTEVQEWYNQALTALAESQLLERGMLQQHNDYKLEIERIYQEQLMALRRNEQDQTLGHYQSFFGTMAGALQSGGEQMLAISKAFGVAEAIVSMWRGAAKALELPFPANLAAWAQVLATGMKAVQGIKSARPGGGATSAGASASSAAITPQVPERVVRIDLIGPDFAK